jgi:phage tail-like protein
VTVVPRVSVLPARQRPRRDPDWMLQQLPVAMLSEDFFVRFVSIFQELGTTLLEDADNVDNIVDPSVAPVEVVRWLGSWIGSGAVDGSLPEVVQRRIVASAALTLTRRGTVQGLHDFLHLVTGQDVEVQDGGGVWRDGEAPDDTAWVRMAVVSTGTLELGALVAVLRDEIPAHVRAELYVGGDLAWTTEREEG